MSVLIVDYHMGNQGSIANMIKKIGFDCKISNRTEDIINADKIILPGVGSFDRAISNIEELGILNTLKDMALIYKKPFLGICLGMQLLANSSEEGIKNGLGLINASVIKFKNQKNNKNYKIPHMGWNLINIKKNLGIFNEMPKESRFYFVHSYYMQCKNEDDIVAETDYILPFTSIVNKNNIYGFQFHPEKSHKFGKQILTNFLRINVKD